jgi:probable phosphoglycerate mutase
MEGFTFDEAAPRFPDTCRVWVDRPSEIAFPGGESFEALRARVLAARDEILRLYPASTVTVFAHAGPIRVLVAARSGLSATELSPPG